MAEKEFIISKMLFSLSRKTMFTRIMRDYSHAPCCEITHFYYILYIVNFLNSYVFHL